MCAEPTDNPWKLFEIEIRHGLMYTKRFTFGIYGCFSAVFGRFVYHFVGLLFLFVPKCWRNFAVLNMYNFLTNNQKKYEDF